MSVGKRIRDGWALVQPYIGVTLPREIFIENWRLAVFLFALRVGVIIWIILNYWGGQSSVWLKESTPTGSARGFADIESENTQRYQRDSLREMLRPEPGGLCDPAQLSRLAYVHDKPIHRNFSVIHCGMLPFPDEAVYSEVGTTFVPTVVRDTHLVTTAVPDLIGDCKDCELLGGCSTLVEHTDAPPTVWSFSGRLNVELECICECVSRETFFVPGVLSVPLHFFYEASVDYRGRTKHLKNNDMVNIIRDNRTEEVIATVGKGEPIALTVGELLAHANLTNVFASSVSDSQPNQITGNGVSRYPVTRITGAEIVIHLNYNKNHVHSDQDIDNKLQTVYLSVEVFPKWTSLVQMSYDTPPDQHGKGISRIRQMEGLRIRGEFGGEFSEFDPFKLFTFIAACSVYLYLPNLVLVLLTCYFLGPLSVIYYNAQVLVVSFRSLLCGILSRSLKTLEMYTSILEREIEDRDDTHTSVSPSMFAQMLGTIFRESDGLDPLEMRTLQGIVLHELCVESPKRVSRTDFLRCVASDEICSRLELAQLFDVQRRRCCFEIFFDTQRSTRLDFMESSVRRIATLPANEMIGLGGRIWMMGSADRKACDTQRSPEETERLMAEMREQRNAVQAERADFAERLHAARERHLEDWNIFVRELREEEEKLGEERSLLAKEALELQAALDELRAGCEEPAATDPRSDGSRPVAEARKRNDAVDGSRSVSRIGTRLSMRQAIRRVNLELCEVGPTR